MRAFRIGFAGVKKPELELGRRISRRGGPPQPQRRLERVGAAAGAVLCVCLLFAALILIRRRNYRRADREERFLRDFRDIRSLLGTMFGPGQIPEDYEEPLREKSAADADLLHLVTGAYNRRRFSRDGAALTPEEGDAAVRLREELLRTVTSGSRHPKLAALRFEAEWEKK